MIYTIGHRASYEAGLAEHGEEFKKLGKGPGTNGLHYAGGSIWPTAEAATAYLRRMPRGSDYAVYGVLADMEADTEQVPGEPFRRLLRTARIVRLEDVQR